MQYLTGELALGVECDLDTCGIWNIGRSDWIDENKFKLVESEDSPFKSYGIEKNKIVPYHEYCTYDVANHVRAYCDMLYAKQFDALKDLFPMAINSAKARSDIFMLVYGKLRNLAEFHDINEFMGNEFGNAWYSYTRSIMQSADFLGSEFAYAE